MAEPDGSTDVRDVRDVRQEVRDVRNEAVTLQTQVTELWQLVLTYFQQETVDPLKSLGRYIAFGLAGALIMAIGALMAGLGILRLVQAETKHHLAGNLSWAPYLFAVLVFGLAAGFAVWRLTKSFPSSSPSSRPGAK